MDNGAGDLWKVCDEAGSAAMGDAMTVGLHVAYTSPRAIQAEGARIGLVTCGLCGAVVLLDPDEEVSALQQHTQWHTEIALRRMR